MNQLPPECVALILKHLPAASLTVVLCCNRLLFESALPLLYSDPFAICAFANRPALFDVLLRSAKLSIEHFLHSYMSCQCKHPTCPATIALTKAMTPSPQAKPVKTTTARYMDALTSFDSQLWMSFAVKAMPPEYRKLAPKFFLEIMNTVMTRSSSRLSSLVLLPGFVVQTLPLAPHMVSLTKLRLAGVYDRMELARVIQFLKANKRCRIKDVNLPRVAPDKPDDDGHRHHHSHLVQQQHHHHYNQHSHGHSGHHYHQTHGGDGGDGHDHQNAVTTNDQFRTQQLQLILSLGQPESLEANACQDFSAVAHRIPCQNLSKLSTFKYVLGFMEGDGNLFLRRCRVLRELDFASFEKDVFAWAAEESRKALQEGALDQGDNIELVQLSQLKMAVSEWMVGRTLRSISQGFAHSLESLLFMVYDHAQLLNVLCSHTVTRIESAAVPDVTFKIDRAFQCPKLKKIRMIRATEAVQIGDGAFEGCPMLENLQLNGAATCAEGANNFGVWQIPELKYLEVGHGMAHKFRIETLAHSPLLESVSLRDCIPSELTLYEAPSYTVPWTWTMPHLNTLQISGRSAYEFRFEWIRQAPNLTTLVVDGVHSDALTPYTEDIAKGPCGALLTSCNFQIHGQCDFDRNCFATLLETYCPKVLRLRLLGRLYASSHWKSVDLGLALFATRNLMSLERLKLHGSTQSGKIAMQALRFGLIRGLVHGDKLFWRNPEELKELLIEALDGGEGCNVYRQKKCCVFSA
ncbi:hypothetical protein MVEG_08669 [Podila verticillata NRRL 6337]|nr:hypothetical protein MVEG_08669 [Podila verticillata NRRL 6337]